MKCVTFREWISESGDFNIDAERGEIGLPFACLPVGSWIKEIKQESSSVRM